MSSALEDIRARSAKRLPGVPCGVSKALEKVADPQAREDIVAAMMEPPGTYTYGAIAEVLCERAGQDLSISPLTVGNHARMLRGDQGGKCRCDRRS